MVEDRVVRLESRTDRHEVRLFALERENAVNTLRNKHIDEKLDEISKTVADMHRGLSRLAWLIVTLLGGSLITAFVSWVFNRGVI